MNKRANQLFSVGYETRSGIAEMLNEYVSEVFASNNNKVGIACPWIDLAPDDRLLTRKVCQSHVNACMSADQDALGESLDVHSYDEVCLNTLIAMGLASDLR